MTTFFRQRLLHFLPVVFTLLLTLGATTGAFAQNNTGSSESDFRIDSVGLNDAEYRIELYVRAIRDGKSERLEKEGVRVRESMFNGTVKFLKVDNIVHRTEERSAVLSIPDTLNILFLTGVGADILPDVAQQRRALIQNSIDAIGTGANSTNYYIASYGDNAPLPKSLDYSQVDATLTELENRQDQYAELYYSIVEATRFMRERKGKWVLFILTDGKNRENPAQYGTFWPYELSDVQYFLSQLSLNTFVVPIGIGSNPDTAFLRLMVRATGNPSDTCAVNSLPPGLRDQIARKVDIRYNNIIRCYPSDDPVFRYREPRTYTVHWIGGPSITDSTSIRFDDPKSTQSKPHTLGKIFTGASWLERWAFGLIGVLLALGVMAYTVPWLEKQNFKKNYVKPYQPVPGRIQRDPITGEPFAEGEFVVTKCSRQTTSLQSWEYVGHKCPNYPKCLDNVNPCDGAGAPSGQEKFFSGKGINRRLNWLWFGMVGGLIGWSLFALLNLVGYKWYNSFLLQFWGERFGSGERYGSALDAHIQTLTDETLLGAAFGAGLCFMLSWAEERSQPRKISWLRIILRTLFGLLASSLVFLFGFFLHYKGWVSSLFVSGLITWLLFGLVVGIVLSMRSAIPLRRGALGGLGAALVGYAVYAIGNAFSDYDFASVKLISFVILGGLLGLLLVTVVSRADDFELEYVSPEQFRQVNPISKWLKNGVDIFIGRESGNYVYVKWDDEAVQPYHARLFYDKGTVFIEPLAETLLNGKLLPIKANTPLQNGDLLQLGRESNTRMRYREKRRADGGAGTPRPSANGGGFRINN